MTDMQTQDSETRRGFLNRIVGGAAALALAGSILPDALQDAAGAGSAWSQNTRSPMTTTTTVNFRAQPDFSGEILDVIPAGTTVVAKTVVFNGFRAVTYKRMNGWIWAEFLV
jgi:uncharacterized protein YgiM (DUF1202 family)